MFDSLSEKLERAFKMLKGQGKITEINISETLKEIRRALIDADVNYKIAKEFTERVKEKAIGRSVLTAVSPGQLMVKICHEELAELMGNQESTVALTSNPTIILMAGLQGSGKTTFSAKLANYFKNKKGKKLSTPFITQTGPLLQNKMTSTGRFCFFSYSANTCRQAPQEVTGCKISNSSVCAVRAIATMGSRRSRQTKSRGSCGAEDTTAMSSLVA